MKKIGLIFGVVGGAVLSALLIFGMTLWHNGTITFEGSELFGYGGMLLALSVVFFGMKSYRDNYLKGTMRFVKGLQFGLLVSAVASLMYATTWEVYRVAASDAFTHFMEYYTQCQIDEVKAGGATQEEVDATSKQMADYLEMYKNPAIRFGITLLEVFPVGLLVSIVSAALLRRKEVLPA